MRDFAKDEDLDAEVFLIVGTYKVNGFNTSYNGKKIVLLCLEWFESEKIASIVTVHELFHVYHRQNYPEWQPSIALGLLSEGLAALISEKSVPGDDSMTYLWPGMQPPENWEKDYQLKKSAMVKELLPLLAEDSCGPWADVKGLSMLFFFIQFPNAEWRPSFGLSVALNKLRSH